MNKRNILILVLSVGLILGALFIVFEPYQESGIGVIDTQAIVALQAQKIIALYKDGKVPPEKLQQIANTLRAKAGVFGAQKNLILLSKSGIWSGNLPDYTDEFLAFLKSEESVYAN